MPTRISPATRISPSTLVSLPTRIPPPTRISPATRPLYLDQPHIYLAMSYASAFINDRRVSFGPSTHGAGATSLLG